MKQIKCKCGDCGAEINIDNGILNFICVACKIKNIVNYPLKCWVDFNYLDYLGAIFSVINGYDFKEIKAATQDEIKAGRFTDIEVGRLKNVLDDSFREGKTI